jgi:hypothetical protein
MANAMLQELGEAVHLNTPVREIEQDEDGVTIHGETLIVRAKRTIVAIPPRLAGRVHYSPALPTDHAQLLDRMPAGEIIKIMTVYDEPFWRADGRSGQSVAMDSPIETTLDASPKSGRGVLASFAFGPYARKLARLAPNERKRVVLDALRVRFGPSGGEPSHTRKQTGRVRNGLEVAAPRILRPASLRSSGAISGCPSAASTGRDRSWRTRRGARSTVRSCRACERLTKSWREWESRSEDRLRNPVATSEPEAATLVASPIELPTFIFSILRRGLSRNLCKYGIMNAGSRTRAS